MKKYNIVFIVSDALRASNLPMYGYPMMISPFLYKFSKAGTVFMNAYSTVDQTDPSFTTILSGRYPLTHGITRHGIEVTDKHLSIFNKTRTTLLSEILVKHGYYTIGIDWLSRWHRRGYKIYVTPSLAKNNPVFKGAINRRIKKLLSDLSVSRRMYLFLFKIFSSLGFSDDKLASSSFEIAEKLIKQSVRHRKPFFVLLHLWDTHTPFDMVPKYLLNKYYDGKCTEKVTDMVRRIKNKKWREKVLFYHLYNINCVDEIEPRYNAEINFVDENIEMFVDYLKDLGVYDDTIILFTADHGENLVRDGIFIGHGGLYQRVIKIPLIIVGPGIPSSSTIDTYIQHIDIVPTILNILGIKTNYYTDGKSLVNTFETGEPIRDYVLAISSTAPKRYALIYDDYKLVWSPSRADAMDKYGGIWFKDTIELYNLQRDNDDNHNLVNDRPDIVRDMTKRLLGIVKNLNKNRIKLMIKNVRII